jgi:tetratricopeptide (TPR) repeat protein
LLEPIYARLDLNQDKYIDKLSKKLADLISIDTNVYETFKGSVYFEMGNYQEAVKNYDKAIQLGENDSKVIIPEGNKRYLAKISHDIKGVLNIKTISHACKILNIVLIEK